MGALDLLFFITLPQVPYGFVCADNSMRIVIEKPCLDGYKNGFEILLRIVIMKPCLDG